MPIGQGIRQFKGGLNKDLAPMTVPQDAYVDALNMVEFDKGGNLYSRSNERGTLPRTKVPDGFQVIGTRYTGNRIIVFLVNTATSTSEIGYFDISNNYLYTTVFNDSITGQQSSSPLKKLNFNIAHQISTEARIAFNGNIYVYYTDGLNPIRWIDIDRDALSNPYDNIDTDMSVFSNTSIATASYVQTLESGNLTAGAYQFAVRYIDDNNNATPFGLISNTVPVVSAIRSNGRNDYTGDPIDTARGNKAIELTLSNVDPGATNVQLAIIKYEGTALTPTIYLSDKINNRGTSFNYIVSTISTSNGTISLNELTQETVTYSTAKHIAQKNSRLFYANLTQETFSEDLQAVANNVIVSYKVEETLLSNISSFFGDYKDESNTFYKKGYRRDEVYAFSVGFVLQSGEITPFYHIPGPASGVATRDGTATDANAFGTLGETITNNTINLQYPNGYNLPSGIVRHHKMPNITEEPIFRNDSGDIYLRVLGIEVTNIDLSALPSDIQSKIRGVVIGRATRFSTNNKSIISQGLIQKYIRWGSGAETNGEGTVTLNPFYGNTLLPAPSGGWQLAGVGNTFLETADSRRFAAFLSPDTELTQFTEANSVDFFTEEARMSGLVINNFGAGLGATDSVTSNLNVHTYCDFNTFIPTALGGNEYIINDMFYSGYVGQSVEGLRVATNGGGVFKLKKLFNDGADDYYLYNLENEGHYTMELNASFNDYPVSDLSLSRAVGVRTYNNETSGTITAIRQLINLRRNTTNQYGEVTSIDYIPIYTLNSVPISSDVLEVFNGDTFVTKYACKNSTKFAILGKTNNRTGNEGEEMRAISHFFVESAINCEYRHEPEDGLPFYPNTQTLTSGNDIVANSTGNGVLDIFPGLGHSNGYNTSYSVDNSLKIFTGPTRITSGGNIIEHPTRIIYSERLQENQVSDNYRVFLVDNFQDMPKNKGEITNLIHFNNILYAHTVETLFQTFVEQQKFIPAGEDEVIVGSGAVFSLPPMELFTQDGGYAGCQSKWASVITPFGFIFPDVSQGKIFMLTNTLTDLGQKGMSSYFLNKLVASNENPANPNSTGLVAVFDNNLKRYILTSNTANSFTISYGIYSQSWISEHSYRPRVLMSINDEVYSFLNPLTDNFLQQHNVGNFGSFYGIVYPSSISMPLNDGQNAEKVFDTIHFHTEAINEAQAGDPIVIKETFDTIQAYNKYQNTDVTNLVISTPKSYNDNLQFRHNEFHTAIPRDKVINPNNDIFNISNLVVTSQYQPRMSGKYIITKLSYNNNNNYRLILDYLKYNFRAKY